MATCFVTKGLGPVVSMFLRGVLFAGFNADSQAAFSELSLNGGMKFHQSK